MPQENALSSCSSPVTLGTQMTAAQLQELQIVLRSNDANSCMPLQALSIENPESEIVVKTEPEQKVPCQINIILFD